MYLIARTETFAKLFFAVSFAGLFIYIFLAFYTVHSAFYKKTYTKEVQKKIQSFPIVSDIGPIKHKSELTTKHILWWNDEENPIEEGQEPFMKYDCLHQNCYITANKYLLKDYTDFHAILFNGNNLRRWNKTALPLRRSWAQKYVFFSKSSAEDVPICNSQADNFFNWTWTYRLDSDIISPFFEVRDLNGDYIAPNVDVAWTKYIDEPIDFMTVNKTNKTKAMATIWKICGSGKGLLIRGMVELKITPFMKNADLTFDIYGCKNTTCDEKCLKNIKDNYYFFYVNNGISSEDYVTDEVLSAIETDTVPVMAGQSDFRKFLPPGSYIDSGPLDADDLPQFLFYVMQRPEVYFSYFRWKKYYTIQRTPKFEGLCELCSKLNNPGLMERRTHYRMFRRWWYSGNLQERCMKRYKDTEPMAPVWRRSYYRKKNRTSSQKMKK